MTVWPTIPEESSLLGKVLSSEERQPMPVIRDDSSDIKIIERVHMRYADSCDYPVYNILVQNREITKLHSLKP